MTIEHLETLIAFAAVMLGVSLLITILTQMLAALFGLRGTNLLWGLKMLFTTMDKGLEAQSDSIARDVLTHPLISDSAFSRISQRMKAMWGLKWVLRVIDAMPPLAALLAWPVKRWRLASAIRVEELQRVLSLLYPGRISGAMGDLEAWFNTAMDRVSARFSLQMRLWTVVFSLMIAFVAHLDAFRLLGQLSSNAELRASLASSADAMTKKAEEVFATSRTPVPASYGEAMEQLKKQYPEVSAKLGQPPVFQQPEEAVAWLRSKLGPGDQAEKVAGSYLDLVRTVALRNTLGALTAQAGGIRSELSRSRLQLIPEPYHTWDFWPGWNFRNRHFWGILVAAGLLSLGAPFWFNALKSLSSLRPLLAARSDDEADTAAR